MDKISSHTDTAEVLTKNEKSIDDFFDEFGTNFYQIIVLFALSLGTMHEGSQLTMISIVNVIYSHDAFFNGDIMTIFNSVFYAGNLIGALCGGFVADLFGRRIPVLVTVLLLYGSALMLSFFTNFYIMCTFRCLYGFGMGIFGTIGFTFCSEIMARKFRGIALAILGSTWTFGSIFTVCLSLIFSDQISLIPWQRVLFIINQTALISALLLFFYIEESPRYTFLVKRNFDKGLKELNAIKRKSQKNDLKISEEEVLLLSMWVENNKTQKNVSFLEIFKGKYLSRTFYSSLTMFALCFVYYGISYITPLIYEKEKKNSETISLLYPSLAELIANVFSITMIDMKYFGRKNSLYIGNLLLVGTCILVSFLLYHDNFGTLFWLGISASRLLVDFGFIVFDCFQCEIYSTRIRGIGLGFGLAFGKLGNSFMPVVVDELLNYGSFYIFILFAIISASMEISLFYLPKETRGEELEE